MTPSPKNTPSPHDEQRRRFYFILIIALAVVNGVFILSQLNNTPTISQEQATGFELANQAVRAYDAGNYQDAIENYTRALQFLPDDAGVYYNRALAHLALDNPTLALADIERAIATDEGYAPPYLVLGDLLDQQQRPQETLAAYQTYISLVGNSGDDAPRILIRIAELERELNP